MMGRSALICALILFVSGGCSGDFVPQPPFVVCAVGSTLWAGGECGAGEGGRGFQPEDLDGQLCDHFLFLIKGFEFVHETGVRVSERQKIRNAFLAKGVSLREGPFRRQVMAFMDLDHPQIMLPETDEKVQELVEHTVRFLKSHELDGLCLKSNDLGGEKLGHYLKVLKALRMAFSRQGLILSPSLPPKNLDVYSDGELMELLGLANYILVDSGFQWDASQDVTGLHAPVSALNSTVLWYEKRGIPRVMMVPMVALAGVTAKLKDISHMQVGARTDGPVFEAPNFFFGDGFIPASEMMKRLTSPKESWVVRRDEASNLPFAANADGLWVSYEDPSSMRTKANFIRQNELAGGLMMTVEMDDFRGVAGEGRYPLISSFGNELHNSGN